MVEICLNLNPIVSNKFQLKLRIFKTHKQILVLCVCFFLSTYYISFKLSYVFQFKSN